MAELLSFVAVIGVIGIDACVVRDEVAISNVIAEVVVVVVLVLARVVVVVGAFDVVVDVVVIGVVFVVEGQIAPRASQMQPV